MITLECVLRFDDLGVKVQEKRVQEAGVQEAGVQEAGVQGRDGVEARKIFPGHQLTRIYQGIKKTCFFVKIYYWSSLHSSCVQMCSFV